MWGWIAYDPDLNLIYYGTGNPGPWNQEQRPRIVRPARQRNPFETKIDECAPMDCQRVPGSGHNPDGCPLFPRTATPTLAISNVRLTCAP